MHTHDRTPYSTDRALNFSQEKTTIEALQRIEKGYFFPKEMTTHLVFVNNGINLILSIEDRKQIFIEKEKRI